MKSSWPASRHTGSTSSRTATTCGWRSLTRGEPPVRAELATHHTRLAVRGDSLDPLPAQSLDLTRRVEQVPVTEMDDRGSSAVVPHARSFECLGAHAASFSRLRERTNRCTPERVLRGADGRTARFDLRPNERRDLRAEQLDRAHHVRVGHRADAHLADVAVVSEQ